MLREYLDWRPFRYFTNRLTPLGRGPMFFPGVETVEFIPTEVGTTMVHYRLRLKDRGRRARLLFRSGLPIARRVALRSAERGRRVMQEDGCPGGSLSSAGAEEETPASASSS